MSQNCLVWYTTDRRAGAGAGLHARRRSGERDETQRPRVLIVDDERLIADTMREILEGEGFEAIAVYDGWDALDVAQTMRPDYLLSDVLMPKMNGVELAIALMQMNPGLKVLLFSGQAGISEIMQEGQERGYQFDLLAKPVHPMRLVERMREK